MMNLVELTADEDECATDQPCKFGNRVSGHAVYCHNEEWSEAPRKCRRSWYTGGLERDEDCPGFAPNPEHPSYAHLQQVAPVVVAQPAEQPAGKAATVNPKPLKGRKLRRFLQEQEAAPVRIDIARMEKALAGPSFLMPQGLSREDKRSFILAQAGSSQSPKE
jgi:hypothetical protein